MTAWTERPAEPGERCPCGRQALVVLTTPASDTFGHCGEHGVTSSLVALDLAVEYPQHFAPATQQPSAAAPVTDPHTLTAALAVLDTVPDGPRFHGYDEDERVFRIAHKTGSTPTPYTAEAATGFLAGLLWGNRAAEEQLRGEADYLAHLPEGTSPAEAAVELLARQRVGYRAALAATKPEPRD